jgi:hypothetical protein
MNLLEEYILKNGEIIILISGLSGSKRSLLAKEIERDFKILKLISLDDYCDENNVPIIELFNQKFKDWDDIIVYDWEKFNKDVNNYKKNGIIIYGDSFPKDKLKFDTKLHIHLTITKEKLVENRREFIESNPDKCKDLVGFLDKLNVFINKITYGHYIKNRNESKITLWLNSNEDTLDKMYDKTFDFIINEMKFFLNEYYATHERKFNFINNEKIKDVINSDNDSDNDSDSNVDNQDSLNDELDKIYKEENKGNISLGSYNDLKMEAQFTN